MDNLIKLLILPTVIGLSGGIIISQTPQQIQNEITSPLTTIKEYRERTLAEGPAVHILKATPTVTSTPTPLPTLKPEPRVQPTALPQPTDSSSDWGVAEQVGEHTYTIKVGNDDRMANPQEVLEALNAYRATNGVGQLAWDDKLAQYSQDRANHFKNISNIDAHEGFNNFLSNEDGFAKLGFMRLGENSYYGGPLTGTHLIEWVFAKSPGHNSNQLDSAWSNVGVGVTDTSVNLIFGGEHM